MIRPLPFLTAVVLGLLAMTSQAATPPPELRPSAISAPIAETLPTPEVAPTAAVVVDVAPAPTPARPVVHQAPAATQPAPATSARSAFAVIRFLVDAPAYNCPCAGQYAMATWPKGSTAAVTTPQPMTLADGKAYWILVATGLVPAQDAVRVS